MKILTTKMIREINELAIKETEQYAKSLADEITPKDWAIVYNATLNGGYHAINDIVGYLIKQLKEEEQ